MKFHEFPYKLPKLTFRKNLPIFGFGFGMELFCFSLLLTVFVHFSLIPINVADRTSNLLYNFGLAKESQIRIILLSLHYYSLSRQDGKVVLVL